MKQYQRKKGPFKFEYMWMTHQKFKENLKKWRKKEATGTTMFRLTKKLDEVKKL